MKKMTRCRLDIDYCWSFKSSRITCYSHEFEHWDHFIYTNTIAGFITTNTTILIWAGLGSVNLLQIGMIWVVIKVQYQKFLRFDFL